MKNKQKKEKWRMGSKIRDIATTSKENRLAFMISLIVANILLLVAGIYYMLVMKEWYYTVLAICILLLCIGYSFYNYKKTNLGRIYTLYDNCIILNSFWRSRCVRYDNIKTIEIKDNCIIIYEKNVGFTKTKVGNIIEDLYKLKDEIMQLVNLYKEKLAIKSRNE